MGELPLRATILLAVGSTVIAAVYLAGRKRPIQPIWFIAASVSVGLFLRGSYAAFVDVVFVSDFLDYWTSASRLAAQENVEVGQSIYYQRALPFLFPLVEVFGQSRVALVLMNATMLCIVQLVGYDLLRRAVNHQAAQAFTIVWLAAPEPLLVSIIPSHDVTGTAMFAAALWLNGLLLVRAKAHGSSWHMAAATGIALGFVLFLLDMARGSGMGWLMLASGLGIAGALGVQALADQDRSLLAASAHVQRLALQLGCGAAVFAVLLSIASASGWRIDGATQQWLRLRAGTPQQTALSDGTYRFVMRFHRALNYDLNESLPAFEAQAQSISRSEFIERPVARIWNTLERAGNLSRLGSQQYFYLAERATQPPLLVRAARLYNTFFVLAFSLLSLYGLARLIGRPLRHPVVLQQAALMGAMILGLLLMRENQPRYIFLIWMVGSFISGFGLSQAGYRREELAVGLVRGLANVILAMGLILGLAFAGWLWLLGTYLHQDGRVITRWNLLENGTPPSTDKLLQEQTASTDVLNIEGDGTPRTGKEPYLVAFDELSLKLSFFEPTETGETVSAGRRVCADVQAPLALTFQYYTPYKKLERKGAFTLSVLADNKVIWEGDLPAATSPARVTTPPVLDPGLECVELMFQLTSNRDLVRKSWVRASKVEIFYPHLTQVQR